jgi:hypothetical protein
VKASVSKRCLDMQILGVIQNLVVCGDTCASIAADTKLIHVWSAIGEVPWVFTAWKRRDTCSLTSRLFNRRLDIHGLAVLC